MQREWDTPDTHRVFSSVAMVEELRQPILVLGKNLGYPTICRIGYPRRMLHASVVLSANLP